MGSVDNPLTRVGYTAGTFDLFHIGHLNLLREARARCDFLIVGVSTDELALATKGSAPLIPYDERLEIVQSVRFVDEVVTQEVQDKFKDWERLKFTTLFAGENRRGEPWWESTVASLNAVGVTCEILPGTRSARGGWLEREREFERAPEELS